jgi:hypothetical protein
MEIHSTAIKFRDWKTGQIVVNIAAPDGPQYEITDHEIGETGYWVTLRRLPEDERVKPEFIAGEFD